MTSLRSMTAFGQASYIFEKGTLIVEMQSGNRRFLEINFTLPTGFSRFETALRKLLMTKIGRGGVNVLVKFIPNPALGLSIMPNLALAKGLQQAWETLASTLNVKESFSLSLLAGRERELFIPVEEQKEEELYLQAFGVAVQKALETLIQMKETEGTVLAEDLLSRCRSMVEKSNLIAKKSQSSTEHYRKKLVERMETALGMSHLAQDERVLKEIALFAEKVDITEEVVRLHSHLEAMEKLLMTSLKDLQEVKGKTLEFLVQEMLRETNTIGSKSVDKEVIHLVIEIKAELEKIKEQSQNIE